MEDALKKWLEDALAHYDRVVFLYPFSEETCMELGRILKKEKRKILLLTEKRAPDFPCSQRKLCEEECRRLLELYISYSFSDRFVFLADQGQFPWPSVFNFVEAGSFTRGEVLEAMLK